MAAPRALVRNAADEQQVKSAARAELRGRDLELAELRDLLARPEFGRLLWRVLAQTFYSESTFSSDALLMAARSGARNVGLWLQAECEAADPHAMTRLLLEALQTARDHEATLTASQLRSAFDPSEDPDAA